MTNSTSFGKRSTADQVLAGIDLTGKRYVVTGCNSGLGYETMNALAANGATVIGLARTFDAASQACARANPTCIPVACDLADFDSIAAAVRTIRNLADPFDAIVANAGVANLQSAQVRYGVEMHFLVNHLGHFVLVNELADRLRDHDGRIVVVSGGASIDQAPAVGIMFDNLDGSRSYSPQVFYGQSKLANVLYAKELSCRLSARGIAVNAVDPGASRTDLDRGARPRKRPLASLLSRLFTKTPAQGAATQTLLAASPQVAGISGEYWTDCKIAQSNPLVSDDKLAMRLWDVSEEIVVRHALTGTTLQHAA
jgi:NAD(P)-dependent dehydrogenase (short-subunit alcohol dehydrogenase family)